MSRTSYVIRDGKLWERGTEPPRVRGPRSSLPCPAIRSDGMEAIRSMADGRLYDGKSAYYESVKRAGCEIVGDDRAPFDRRPTHEDAGIGVGVAEDLKRTIEELESR